MLSITKTKSTIGVVRIRKLRQEVAAIERKIRFRVNVEIEIDKKGAEKSINKVKELRIIKVTGINKTFKKILVETLARKTVAAKTIEKIIIDTVYGGNVKVISSQQFPVSKR